MGGGGSKESASVFDVKVSGHLIDQIAHEQLGLQVTPAAKESLRNQREHRIWVSDLTEQERKDEVARMHKREKDQLHYTTLELTQKVDVLNEELEALKMKALTDKESKALLESRLIEFENLNQEQKVQQELERQFQSRISAKVIESQADGFVPTERTAECGAERDALAECLKNGRDSVECSDFVRGLNACSNKVQKDFVLHATQIRL